VGSISLDWVIYRKRRFKKPEVCPEYLQKCKSKDM